jgi:hypothetical protein
MDKLKSVAEICEPDSRQLGWWIENHDAGSTRPLTLEEHHASIARIVINEEVPEDIRQHMETAKNLLLYSWYVYRFIPVAELHAYAAFEWALRARLGIEDGAKPSFSKLLDIAIKKNLLSAKHFADFAESLPFPLVTGNDMIDANLSEDIHSRANYMEVFREGIVGLRNLLAHGSFTLWPGGNSTLIVIARAINTLFAPREP